MINRNLYIHTNLPAPYRKHLFEAFTRQFRMVVVYFCMEPDNTGRWNYDLSDWRVDCRVNCRVTELVWDLIRQRWGSIHLWGGGGSLIFGLLLIASGLIGHSKLVAWNDAGFPENVNKAHKRNFWHNILHCGYRVRNFLWRSACVCVFASGKLGEKYSKALGFPAEKVVNAYFSHDVEWFSEHYRKYHLLDRGYIRNELNIPSDKIVFLNISRFLDWKRLEDLATALLILERESPTIAAKCELILIGGGPWKAHLEILSKLRLIRVNLVGNMFPERLIAYYSAADVFAFPSEGDIWGLVVNEALSMGLPVVCTERIGSAELVEDGVNGFRIPVRAPETLAARLKLLAENKDMRMEFSMAARKVGVKWRTEYGVRALVSYLGEIA